MAEKELEVKFYLKAPQAFETRLRSLGAALVVPRTFELNLRFDTPDGALSRGLRVLRLRQYTGGLMTYKGPSENRADVTSRQEIEFEVGDFDAARHLLEALGYQVSVSYEKYRTTYEWEGTKVTLDELPYGNFCEVEGPDAETIQSIATQLGLDWSTRVMDSYLRMFDCLKTLRGYGMPNLTFGDFEDVSVSAEDLGVHPAD